MELAPCRYGGPSEQVHCPSRLQRESNLFGTGEGRLSCREEEGGRSFVRGSGVWVGQRRPGWRNSGPSLPVFLRAPTKVARTGSRAAFLQISASGGGPGWFSGVYPSRPGWPLSCLERCVLPLRMTGQGRRHIDHSPAAAAESRSDEPAPRGGGNDSPSIGERLDALCQITHQQPRARTGRRRQCHRAPNRDGRSARR